MKKMNKFTRSEKDPNALNVKSLLLPISFCLVCGVLLIVLKSTALRITSMALAAGMIGWGGYCIFKYFRSDPMTRITEIRLALGLILVVSGAMLMFSPDFLDNFLPFIWGLAMLFGSFLKIQFAFDERTVKVEKWWIMLIFAAASLVLSILSLLRPEFFGDSMEIIIGIFLIAEAVIDGMVFFLLNRAMKAFAPKATVPIPAEPSAAPVPPGAASVPPAAPAPGAPPAPRDSRPASAENGPPDSPPGAPKPAAPAPGPDAPIAPWAAAHPANPDVPGKETE